MNVFELFLKNLRTNFPNYLKIFVISITELNYIVGKKLIHFERISIVIFVYKIMAMSVFIELLLYTTYCTEIYV